MTKALINARVLTPNGFKDKQSVMFKAGVITEICSDDERPASVKIDRDVNGLTLLPGFIDTQVNGGGGVLFNNAPTVETIKTIGRAHRNFGTTGFFPTLISDDLSVMATAIKAVDRAIDQNVPGVRGIHLEGPFLNPDKRGVHDASKFGQIGAPEIELLSSLKNGKTIVTLAPETTTPKTIQALCARGIIVCAGHSMAQYAQAKLAMDAGLTGFTHLYNAMRPLDSREPGLIAAALEDERAWCGIITDGHHVHPAMLRLALRAKNAEQIFLVTDAMPSVGAKHKPFSLGDMRIHVADGKCVTDDGTLAGSDLDMMSAVRNAEHMLGIDFAQAVHMASSVPARFVGLDGHHGEIRPGHSADFVLISPDRTVKETWIAGKIA